MPHKSTIIAGACTVAAIAVVILITWGVWQVGRKWNYELSYKSMVQDTVKEMVKPEALKKEK